MARLMHRIALTLLSCQSVWCYYSQCAQQLSVFAYFPLLDLLFASCYYLCVRLSACLPHCLCLLGCVYVLVSVIPSTFYDLMCSTYSSGMLLTCAGVSEHVPVFCAVGSSL